MTVGFSILEQIQMNNPASDETFYVYESTAQSLENNSTRKGNVFHTFIWFYNFTTTGINYL